MTAIDLPMPGLALVPRTDEKQSAKDFKTDQEVRWCFVSGIGCSSRFPYYMDTYGVHSIHGRAPAIATGIAITRPDLSVWVVTGDGDALSIGGNHLIHALRRNVNLKILLFNNRIYGLTKGQYSPTSETGKVTKSTPLGSLDYSFNPVSIALGAEASFVARTIDSDRKHLTETLRRAAAHEGTALVEILQNCNIFNDGAWEPLKDVETSDDYLIRLVDGEEVRFGKDGSKVVVRGADGHLMVANAAEVDQSEIIVFDSHAKDPGLAFALSRLSKVKSLRDSAIGVFRDVERPSYDRLVREQVATVREAGEGDLGALIRGKDTWTVT
jgi:2-oxoglutarate ferredoxin oxidoreductase subunit beta